MDFNTANTRRFKPVKPETCSGLVEPYNKDMLIFIAQV